MELDKDELPVKLKLTESLPCSLECVKQLICSPVPWNHPHRKILDPLLTFLVLFVISLSGAAPISFPELRSP